MWYIPKSLYYTYSFTFMVERHAIQINVRKDTHDLYYKKFYDAKANDHSLTHDKFIRKLMGYM